MRLLTQLVELLPINVQHSLGLCKKQRLGYRCHGKPGECGR